MQSFIIICVKCLLLYGGVVNIKKVQLINAPLDTDIRGAGHLSAYPPLGLLYLGTYIKDNYPEIETEIIDGSVTPMNDIKIDADLVGIGALVSNYSNTLKIGKEAKNKNATVILGHDYAKTSKDLILRNRDYIDYASHSHQGWETMLGLLDLLEGKVDTDKVPGLSYRNGKEIKSNKPRSSLSDRKLIADRSLVDMEKYSENYGMMFGNLHGGEKIVPATVQFMKGCGWKNNNGCMYCGITDSKPEHIDDSLAGTEYKYLMDNGVNFIYEVCDDILSQPKEYIEALISKGVKIDFAYSRASSLNERSIDLLKRLGLRRLNIGMDSGDEAMLNALNKNYPNGRNTNIDAIEKLAKNGIEVYMSLVFGAPGETEDSLKRTIEFFDEAIGYGNIVAVDPSALLPLRTSHSWNMMMQNEKYREKYMNSDIIDTEELAHDWMSLACPEIDYNAITNNVNRISDMAIDKGILIGGYGVKGC